MTDAAADIALETSFETMKDKGAPALRKRAWETFARTGLPSKRIESWHYTDLRSALRTVAPLAGATGETPDFARAGGGLRLVILDGVFRADLSSMGALPSGLRIHSLREALAEGDPQVMTALAAQGTALEDPVVALNAALMQDGVVIRIESGVQLAPSLRIETLTSGPARQSTYSRSLALVGEGASARIEETYRAGALTGAQENSALLLSLAPDAKVEHIAHFEPQAEDAVRVASLIATLGRASKLHSFCLVEGGGLLRRQIFAELSGEEASVAFNGVSLLRGRSHADATLVIDHVAPHGKSREKFRTILDDEATGVFQGKVIVRPGAQKTDGGMQSKSLLLSNAATMNNKPELEIFADDVLCGHGATCGRLDADQLFYLEARGLPRQEAEALLIEGFANEALDGIAVEAIRERLGERVRGWLIARECRA